MERVDVIPGVCVVDVPESGLSVLCGSPADVVKHLMRRGVIVGKRERGVWYETGPNAILLSDVSVQNGQFSNLAEFPVLQMLYRQGMIVPGHPRNSGRRPMLIGLAEQLRAQSAYIRLGNYGLDSVEEIQATGLPPAAARDLMRVKLRFAFDRIRKAEELLEFRVVDRDVITLAEGLRLRRLGPNRYQFIHEEETVEVDMNLTGWAGYPPPYRLDHHRIEREYFSIVHTGEGDGWDTDRPCMSSIVTFQGRIYLIDAGPNILSSLVALGIGVSELAGVFHTHCHDDHFAGLPTLMRSPRSIPYYAAPVVRRTAQRKLSALLGVSEERFRDYFEIHDLELERWNDVGGLEVRPILSPHPVETTVLHFRAMGEDGYRTYGHLADLVSFETLEGLIAGDETSSGVTPVAARRYRDSCLEPMDLKKVDVGGGMIHGAAADFVGDRSGKLVLSHKSGELSDAEKQIGSSAAFGTQDVLIGTRCDSVRRSAESALREHLEGASDADVYMLLNCEIVEGNVGQILLKTGDRVKDVHLLLSGVAEFLDAPTGARHALATGSFVGGLGALSGLPSQRTYRAASYVKTLRIPVQVYRHVAERTGLLEQLREVQEVRHFLQNSWLFGEMVSFRAQVSIAKHISRLELDAEREAPVGDGTALYLLAEGRVELGSARQVVEGIDPGGFWGEYAIVEEAEGFLRARTRSPSVIWVVPTECITGIPIVSLKLQETLERRRRAFLVSFDFAWDESFAVGIGEIDRQHAALFRAIAAVEHAAHAPTQSGAGALADLVREVVTVAGDHFRYEEQMLERVGYAGLETQRVKHREYLHRARAILEMPSRTPEEISRYIDAAREWITTHTLMEDRKYGKAVRVAES